MTQGKRDSQTFQNTGYIAIVYQSASIDTSWDALFETRRCATTSEPTNHLTDTRLKSLDHGFRVRCQTFSRGKHLG